MSIDKAIVAFLRADTALLALYSTRQYPSTFPQGVIYPSIAYQRIDGDTLQSHDGDTGVVSARYQLTLNDIGFERFDQGSSVVKNRLRYYNRNKASFSGYISGVRVDSIRIVDDQVIWEPVAKEHRRLIDFIVTYAEG